MYKSTAKESGRLSRIVDENAIYLCKQDIICINGIFEKGSLVMLKTTPFASDNQHLKIGDFESGCLNNCIAMIGYDPTSSDENFEITPGNFEIYLEVENYVTSKWKALLKERGNIEYGIFSEFRESKFIKNKRKFIESFTLEERVKYKLRG